MSEEFDTIELNGIEYIRSNKNLIETKDKLKKNIQELSDQKNDTYKNLRTAQLKMEELQKTLQKYDDSNFIKLYLTGKLNYMILDDDVPEIARISNDENFYIKIDKKILKFTGHNSYNTSKKVLGFFSTKEEAEYHYVNALEIKIDTIIQENSEEFCGYNYTGIERLKELYEKAKDYENINEVLLIELKEIIKKAQIENKKEEIKGRKEKTEKLQKELEELEKGEI